MAKFKENAKSFVRVYKGSMVVTGAIVTGMALYIAGYKKGAIHGVAIGFEETIKWFDKTFDDVHLAKLFEEYAKEHPEEIVTVKF